MEEGGLKMVFFGGYLRRRKFLTKNNPRFFHLVSRVLQRIPSLESFS
jgi:hypothetical protein